MSHVPLTGQAVPSQRYLILQKIKISGLENVFADRISEGSHIITDKASAYRKYSANHKLKLTQLKAGKTAVKGIYNLAHINSYHSELKRFLYRFKGVSSKYLNNYLVWHNFVNYSKESYIDKKQILLAYVLSERVTAAYQNIPYRNPLPLTA